MKLPNDNCKGVAAVLCVSLVVTAGCSSPPPFQPFLPTRTPEGEAAEEDHNGYEDPPGAKTAEVEHSRTAPQSHRPAERAPALVPQTAHPEARDLSETPKDWPKPVEDNQLFGFLLVEQLEYRLSDGTDTFRWEAQGWYGSDYNKLWLKSEGEQQATDDEGGEAELQALYSRMISPFWDVQAGLRYDQLWGPGSDPSRVFGAIGVQGLAPYRYEVEPALFVSEDGDVSARLTATTDLLLTQRLILQPRFETEVAVHEVDRFGVGEGFNYIDLGLRLRYEIKREIAPYIGIDWVRFLAETADIARRDGEEGEILAVVFGLRIWL